MCIRDRDKESDFSIHMGRIIPIYPSTAQLSKIRVNSKTIRKLIKNILDNFLAQIPETLNLEIIKRQNLIDLHTALTQLHFPDNKQQIEAAKKRISFDELFFMELLLALKKVQIKSQTYSAVCSNSESNLVNKFIASLPFPLTKAQKRVIEEIIKDLNSPTPMNRLLQGDVGSGKTIVAICALLKAIEKKQQAALMAPTEVLAEQHFITIHRLLKELAINIVLLVGNSKTKQKETLSAIATGRAQIIIGTHALFQAGVDFKNLGLIVIDEQHKFGVMQRTALYQKGNSPDVLVMTATPIPRTLALTVYGDLDISIIDEIPPRRGTVETICCYENKREQIYQFIENEIKQGHQAYIVYPIIEESEKLDLESAIKPMEFARKLLPPHLNRDRCYTPYLGPLLDAGMAAILAEEIVEAIRYIEDPDFYQPGIEDPDVENGKIWLGAADDAIMRKRGIESVSYTHLTLPTN